MPELAGIHHVKFAVSDIERSVAWYERVFGFKVHDGVQGRPRASSVARWASWPAWTGRFSPSARTRSCPRPSPAFDPVSFAVEDRADVEALGRPTSTSRASRNSGLRIAAIGYIVFFHDPDGIKLHVYSYSTPTARRDRSLTSPGFRLLAASGQRGAGPHSSCLSALMV